MTLWHAREFIGNTAPSAVHASKYDVASKLMSTWIGVTNDKVNVALRPVFACALGFGFVIIDLRRPRYRHALP